MANFIKGMVFTMEGKEYEVISEGTNDPSSCLVYVPRAEKETADPQSLRIWKAEAKLARGDIIIKGYIDQQEQNTLRNGFFAPIIDPLEQIAELKKRIRSIEDRRLTLLKADDPSGRILLQDNIVKPNKAFNIWDYTRTSGDIVKRKRHIQYIKLRGLIMYIASNNNYLEHFYFNVSDQLHPCCRINGDVLSTDGTIKIDLTDHIRTIQGIPTQIINEIAGGHIELEIEIKLNCQFAIGTTIVKANILQAAYIRPVKAPGIKISKLAFQGIGDHSIGIAGISVDIYTAGNDESDIFLN